MSLQEAQTHVHPALVARIIFRNLHCNFLWLGLSSQSRGSCTIKRSHRQVSAEALSRAAYLDLCFVLQPLLTCPTSQRGHKIRPLQPLYYIPNGLQLTLAAPSCLHVPQSSTPGTSNRYQYPVVAHGALSTGSKACQCARQLIPQSQAHCSPAVTGSNSLAARRLLHGTGAQQAAVHQLVSNQRSVRAPAMSSEGRGASQPQPWGEPPTQFTWGRSEKRGNLRNCLVSHIHPACHVPPFDCQPATSHAALQHHLNTRHPAQQQAALRLSVNFCGNKELAEHFMYGRTSLSSQHWTLWSHMSPEDQALVSWPRLLLRRQQLWVIPQCQI